MWFDQQLYAAVPRLPSLSAAHLYCWYAWLLYGDDHVWFNMPGYINSSETQTATQVLEKWLGCFAVVTHHIRLLVVINSSPRSTFGGNHQHPTPQPAELCQPTSSSETCGACKVSGHPSSSHLVTPVTSLYKELGTGKKLAFPLASSLISGFKVQWIQRM